MRTGRPVEALVYLESGRASFSPFGSAGTPASETPTAPRGQIALDFALIGDTLLAWTISDAGVHLARTRLDRAEFTRTAERARAVPASAVQEVLTRAAATSLPIMIFVGNRGCLQIHSGPVAQIEVAGPWLNVLDPRFNLHLRSDLVAGAWVVRKPSVNGEIHALELYDATGEIACQIFGLRHAGGKVVAVTDGPLSPLVTGAEAWFAVTAEGAGPFDSHVGTLALLHALVAGVADRLRGSATDRLDRLEAAWRTTMTNVR